MKMISKWTLLITIGLSCLSMTARGGELFELSTGATGINEQHDITVPSSCTFYSYMQAWGATGWNDFHTSYIAGPSTGFTGVFGGPTGTVYQFYVNSGNQPFGYAEDWRRATDVPAGNYTVFFGGGCGQVYGIWGAEGASARITFHTDVSW